MINERVQGCIADTLTVMEKQSDFGNARFVRNLFEKIIEQQANRLAEIQEYNKCVLKVIEKEDVMKGIERLS